MRAAALPPRVLDLPPDWTADDPPAVACPLCGYDLRHLVEPRCPECGFAFTWAELLDRQRDGHPWLFEHAGRRRDRLHNARAFVATYARTWLPRRFWRHVTPANPVHAGRLVVYWLVASLLLLQAVAPLWPMDVVGVGQMNLELRQFDAGGRANPAAWAKRWGRAFGPPPTVAEDDVRWPVPWSFAFARQVSIGLGRQVHGTRFVALAVVAAWPWLTAAVLLLYQGSMRRAKVAPTHVLRTAVYGCDFGLLMVLLILAYDMETRDPLVSDWVHRKLHSSAFNLDTPLVPLAVVACAAVATYRLSVAYRRYLRFDRPLLTVVAAQLIAILFAFAVSVQLLRWS